MSVPYDFLNKNPRLGSINFLLDFHKFADKY